MHAITLVSISNSDIKAKKTKSKSIDLLLIDCDTVKEARSSL
jgi:hypothetical protein